MTYLQLVNRVLRGLREKQVNTVSGEYPLLIGQLVNEAKEELEDMGPWLRFRTNVDVTFDTGDQSKLVPGVNHRSYLHYERNLPRAFIVTADNEQRLDVIQASEIESMYSLFPDADPGVPFYVGFGRDTNDEITARVFPEPDQSYTLRFGFIVPQGELDDDEDELQLPAAPVWKEALARAMEERGEEFAGGIDRAFQQAGQARNDAVLRDFGAEEYTFEAR